MMDQYNLIPDNIPGNPVPFNFRVPDQELSEFRELLRLSKIGPATWWNNHTDGRFGVSRAWLSQAKEAWLNEFDWRKHEEYINKFPNFKMTVADSEAGQIDIHFAALFSARKDATPIILMHGYPASFVEFLPALELLVAKYTPETLPYHIIVPSLPDYGLSGSSSRNVEMSLDQAARIMNQLMVDLGFGSGYIAQGGDLGSMLARIMSVEHEECKAFHINMLTIDPGEPVSEEDLTPDERKMLQRASEWQQTGLGYAIEHGTRPATAGLAISSSPLTMLAWLGEKYLEWPDQRAPLSLDTVLAMVSFYWFTDSFSRCLWHATLVKNYAAGKAHPTSKKKPFGYSLFTHDLAVLPETWARQVYPNLIFFNIHDEGGHFAQMEQAAAFLEDVEEFAMKVRGEFEIR